MLICYIIRGVPSSGKTTRAKLLLGKKNGIIHSTDDYYFDRQSGAYTFDGTKLEENHGKNFNAFVRSLRNNIPIVICDNCNCKRKDYQRYIDAALHFGYEVRIVTLPHPDSKVAAERNSHGVPQSTIEKMIHFFEPHEF